MCCSRKVGSRQAFTPVIGVGGTKSTPSLPWFVLISRRGPTVGRRTWIENLSDGYLIKAFERIGIFADQQYQGGGLRVGFGSALFPFLESSFVDPQLAGEDGTRATQLGPGAKALLLP